MCFRKFVKALFGPFSAPEELNLEFERVEISSLIRNLDHLPLGVAQGSKTESPQTLRRQTIIKKIRPGLRFEGKVIQQRDLAKIEDLLRCKLLQWEKTNRVSGIENLRVKFCFAESTSSWMKNQPLPATLPVARYWLGKGLQKKLIELSEIENVHVEGTLIIALLEHGIWCHDSGTSFFLGDRDVGDTYLLPYSEISKSKLSSAFSRHPWFIRHFAPASIPSESDVDRQWTDGDGNVLPELYPEETGQQTIVIANEDGNPLRLRSNDWIEGVFSDGKREPFLIPARTDAHFPRSFVLSTGKRFQAPSSLTSINTGRDIWLISSKDNSPSIKNSTFIPLGHQIDHPIFLGSIMTFFNGRWLHVKDPKLTFLERSLPEGVWMPWHHEMQFAYGDFRFKIPFIS